MCAPWDFECKIEGFWTTTAQDLGEHAWSLLAGAFTGQAANISDGQWDVATVFTNKIAAVMAVFTVVVALYQMGKHLFKGNARDAVVPAVVAVLAWPVTAITVFITVKGVGATDQLVVKMLGGSGVDTFTKLFSDVVKASLIAESPTAVPGSAAGISSVILMLIIWVFSLILSMVMIFRNLALLVLVAFAPVALMLLPAQVSRSWSKVWGQTVLALVITKPLAAGILLIAAELMFNSEDMAGVIMGLVALIVACASPMAAMSLVRFTGADSGAAAGAAASGAVGQVAGYTGKASNSLTRGVKAVAK